MTDTATNASPPQYGSTPESSSPASRLQDQVQDQAKKVADAASQAGKVVADRASVARDWALDQGDVIRDTVQTRPFVSVGVSAASAFAAGLVLGVLLTRR